MMNTENFDLIYEGVFEMVNHGHAGPFVAMIAANVWPSVADGVTLNAGVGLVELKRHLEFPPHHVEVMTKADYLEKYA